jgi:CBS domain-containing protein
MSAKEDVSEIMSSPAITVAADAPASHALWLLWEFGIGAVPVVADERVVGIIAEGDLLPSDGLARRTAAVRLRGRVGQPGDIPLIERLVREIDGVADLDARFVVCGETVRG